MVLNDELDRGVYIWNRRRSTPKAIGVGEEMQAKAGKARTSTERPRDARMSDETDYSQVPMPELRTIPEHLWEDLREAVRARFADLDTRMEKQQAQCGGQNRRAGVGSARRDLSVVADVLHWG